MTLDVQCNLSTCGVDLSIISAQGGPVELPAAGHCLLAGDACAKVIEIMFLALPVARVASFDRHVC